VEYDEKYLNKLSRFMSLILRHRPESIGISLDEHGWANVDELLSGIGEQYPIDMDMLEEIVRADKKQRYSFNEDKTLIRANQGHSIPVDVELDEVSPPEELWHGTGEKYVQDIETEDFCLRAVCMFTCQMTETQHLRWDSDMENRFCIL